MEILGAFMVPHPPLIVEEVGGDEIEQIKKTRDSYIKIAKEIGDLKPDTIIVSSPHAPFLKDYFYLPDGDYGKGSFESGSGRDLSRDRLGQAAALCQLQNAEHAVPRAEGLPSGKEHLKGAEARRCVQQGRLCFRSGRCGGKGALPGAHARIGLYAGACKQNRRALCG